MKKKKEKKEKPHSLKIFHFIKENRIENRN
jgi:hypothetical protein